MNNMEMVNHWYSKLINSDIQDKETFVKELKNKIDLQ